MGKPSQLVVAALLGAGITYGFRLLAKVMKIKPVKILITGAAGQIGYALCPMVAGGRMLGPDQPVILHLLDIPPAEKPLEGVRMELMDAAFPLLKDVQVFTDVHEAAAGVEFAIMVGGYPRKPGEERKDVMSKNVSIYKAQAAALEQWASPHVKVVVVANPANTNAMTLSQHAPTIPRSNITCLTRLDHNRAVAQVAERAGVDSTAVKNVIIWGNHSSTQYPDVDHSTVDSKPTRSAIQDDAWLDGPFIKTVQQRGAAILAARGLSSALSAASSVCDHVRDWVHGTPRGSWVSMGVVSDGSYGTRPGLVFSFPVTCRAGRWCIVQGLTFTPAARDKVRLTEAELVQEQELAAQCLAGK